MSTFAPRAVRCPCGRDFSVDLADGLHITRMPHVRQQILDGVFHNVRCPGCGAVRVCHTMTLYTDFERHHWVGLAPPWLIGDWRQWADALVEDFDHNVRRAAPPMIQSMADRFEVRLCFGVDALAEKLRSWDAGLDDRLVEVLKIQLFNQHRQFIRVGGVLRLMSVDKDDWTLTFGLTHPRRPGWEELTTSLDAYLHAQEHRAEHMETLPGLFEGPLCSMDKLFAESLAATRTPTTYLQVLQPLRPQDESWS